MNKRTTHHNPGRDFCLSNSKSWTLFWGGESSIKVSGREYAEQTCSYTIGKEMDILKCKLKMFETDSNHVIKINHCSAVVRSLEASNGSKRPSFMRGDELIMN